MTRPFLHRSIALALAAASAGASAFASPPAPAPAAPDTRFAPAFAEVDRWIARGAFPGAVLAIGRGGRVVALRAFGRLSVDPAAGPVRTDTVYDMASLTKVIATTTAVAILYDRGRIDLDAPVVRYLPEFAGAAGHDGITVRQLLAHASGLTPAGPLWRSARDRRAILRLIDAMPVSGDPASIYRDENFILLGEIVRRVSGRPLDRFVRDAAFAPLGMRDTRFRPPRAWESRIAPTEDDRQLRHRLVRGEVHDETAFLMRGVAGHAGLFSTAPDLARFARMMLGGGELDGRRILSATTVATFMTPQRMPPGSTRALGWDTAGPKGGFAGPLASPRAILHTGFTGTSIYIDPVRDAFVVLLTNRVNPTRDNKQIADARPAIHTAVLAELDREGRR